MILSVCEQSKKIRMIKGYIFVFLLCVFTHSNVFAEGSSVIPGGQSIGVSLNYDGVYVDDLGEVTTYEGNSISPAKNAGIEPGNIVTKINGKTVKTVDEMIRILNSGPTRESIDVTLRTIDGSEKTVNVISTTDSVDNKIKLGIWAKDAASGVGTVTFLDTNTNEFVAVGHEISDAKTGVPVGNLCGDVFRCEIVGIRKGERGTPGELIGVYSENKLKIGTVTSSNKFGVVGTVTNNENFIAGSEPLEKAANDEVITGEAFIFSNIESSRIEKYSINIEKVCHDSDNGKDIIFRVTDENLLQKTGGIVRGMSGSPIIQNGKIIGAVTHVLVNDPVTGYGVFIDNMQK